MGNNKNSDAELISQLNKIKGAYKKAFPFVFVFLGILALCISFVFFNLNSSSNEAKSIAFIGIAISLFALFAILCIRESAVKNMKIFFAEKLIKPYLAEHFDSFEYHPQSRINDHILKRQMHLARRIDEISGSDYIRGIYKGLELEMSDVSLTEVQIHVDSKGRTRKTKNTFFRGLWCVCKLNKTLESDLWITEKTSFFSLNLSTVKTDNEAFNKRFAVRTQTPVEAFYVLTPHMMEYIERMDKKAKGATYLCFLKNGELYIAINSMRDSFEFSFNCDIAKAKKIIETDLSYITGFIDELMESSYYKKSIT